MPVTETLRQKFRRLSEDIVGTQDELFDMCNERDIGGLFPMYSVGALVNSMPDTEHIYKTAKLVDAHAEKWFGEHGGFGKESTLKLKRDALEAIEQEMRALTEVYHSLEISIAASVKTMR
jgi:hypothetical protein